MQSTPLAFRFHSNLEEYEVVVYDGENAYRKRVFGGQGCLCLRPRSPCVRVVASPRENGYATTLYFWVDVRCKNRIDLYFSFPSSSQPPTPPVVNDFTLTDRNYGLPVDGTLLFAQA